MNPDRFTGQVAQCRVTRIVAGLEPQLMATEAYTSVSGVDVRREGFLRPACSERCRCTTSCNVRVRWRSPQRTGGMATSALSTCFLVCAQVLSFGRSGVLGRNGFYCQDSDVDRFIGLAGWRGLGDPRVPEYFNRTFLGFDESWGPIARLLVNLGLDYYTVDYLGAGSAAD